MTSHDRAEGKDGPGQSTLTSLNRYPRSEYFPYRKEMIGGEGNHHPGPSCLILRKQEAGRGMSSSRCHSVRSGRGIQIHSAPTFTPGPSVGQLNPRSVGGSVTSVSGLWQQPGRGVLECGKWHLLSVSAWPGASAWPEDSVCPCCLCACDREALPPQGRAAGGSWYEAQAGVELWGCSPQPGAWPPGTNPPACWGCVWGGRGSGIAIWWGVGKETNPSVLSSSSCSLSVEIPARESLCPTQARAACVLLQPHAGCSSSSGQTEGTLSSSPSPSNSQGLFLTLEGMRAPWGQLCKLLNPQGLR